MKAWQGRFKGKMHPLMERFSASIGYDKALYEYDINGSKAHAEMLERIGLLTHAEKEAILAALDEIKGEIASGEFTFTNALEDIHMHIESRLVEKTGDTGRKIHTGRSRNDQVSLDMRMYLKSESASIDEHLLALLTALVRKAEQEKGTIMPGYTHMQRAQVVPLSHYLMAYYQMLKRDRERLRLLAKSADVLPLGTGALAGSTIPLDREFVRERLGFSSISENSMDTVSDRDFVLDALYAITMIMIHLSRLSEDLIIFSTEEFAFLSLPDELCTGSSLMPHKKNPDALELTRGKTSRVLGDLFSMFSMLKGLPLTYNRDLQEDKEPLFHAVNTVKDALSIMALCIEGMVPNRERMKEAVYGSFMAAVEMAEYLARKGIPFREAHILVGKLVRECEENGRALSDLTLEDLRRHSEAFDEDLFSSMDPYKILEKRETAGAASFKEVEREIAREKKYLHS
jgi:argininosuccinate lyase